MVEVELGNMKNSSDARRMKSATGRDRYAKGLVAGIRVYLGGSPGLPRQVAGLTSAGSRVYLGR